jgi:hypothetical protein
MRAVLVAAILFGCGGGSAVHPESDAATTGPADATVDERDTGPDEDVACQICGYGHCPTRELCLDAPPLEPGMPLTMQDSAAGGHDCAVSGSGNPSKSVYYALALPAQSRMRVVLTPAIASDPALLRVLSDCDASTVEASARNFSVTQGRATLCLANDTAAERRVVIAAGSYAGTIPLTLVFDLSAEMIDPNLGCTP